MIARINIGLSSNFIASRWQIGFCLFLAHIWSHDDVDFSLLFFSLPLTQCQLRKPVNFFFCFFYNTFETCINVFIKFVLYAFGMCAVNAVAELESLTRFDEQFDCNYWFIPWQHIWCQHQLQISFMKLVYRRKKTVLTLVGNPHARIWVIIGKMHTNFSHATTLHLPAV